MVNLLPPEQKKELLEKEKLTLSLILGILIFCFLVSSVLILLLVKNYFLWELEIQKISLEEKEREISLNKDLEGEIRDLNLAVSNLDSFYGGSFDLTGILEKISETLPPDIYLNSFNFYPSLGGEKIIAQISLSGFSPDRETLLSFKENLEREESFSEIYFPTENWLKPADVNFNLTFKFK